MADPDKLPLPRAPHRPGSGSQPDLTPLEAAKAAVPDRTESATWRANLPYRYGWRLFDAGFYWEAHEVWEAVWMACQPNSRERLLLQVLIQIANARLKRAMGKEQAARRLAQDVERLLAEPGLKQGAVMGVDSRALSQLTREGGAEKEI